MSKSELSLALAVLNKIIMLHTRIGIEFGQPQNRAVIDSAG